MKKLECKMCLILLFLMPITAFSSTILGQIDGIKTDGNGMFIKGWACSSGSSKSISTDLYLGAPWPKGAAKGRILANESSELAISSACKSKEGAHRFSIQLTPEMRNKFAAQKIYIYGINPNGGTNSLINGSGAFEVPADKIAPTVDSFITPPISRALTISKIELMAKDDVGVTKYFLSEAATKPLASSPGWTERVPSTYSFSSPGIKTLYAWAMDGAGNISKSKSSKTTIASIAGNIDGVNVNADNTMSIKGWACMIGVTDSISVDLYIGQVLKKSSLANRSSEAAISKACNSSGAAYRFEFLLSLEERKQFVTQKIFIRGVVPSLEYNFTIAGSGNFRVLADNLSLIDITPPPPEDIQIADTGSYMIGTYVFPGWTPYTMWGKQLLDENGWKKDQQWPTIENAAPFVPNVALPLAYQDQPKKPMLGYYNDSKINAVEWMIKWSLESGISLFVYDWFWQASGPVLADPLNTFLNSRYLTKYPDNIHFALLWSNNTGANKWCYDLAPVCPSNNDKSPGATTLREKVTAINDKMIDFAIENYFKRPQHLRISNKPVFMIQQIENLRLGLDGADGDALVIATLNKWQIKAKAKAEFPDGIYFISYSGNVALKNAGVGLSAYNYAGRALDRAMDTSATNAYKGTPLYANKPRWVRGDVNSKEMTNDHPQVALTIPYEHFSAAYKRNWENAVNNVNPNYLPVVSPGWDNSPWQCMPIKRSSGTALDSRCKDLLIVTYPNSKAGYKQGYKNHLLLAKDFVDNNKTLKAGEKKIILNEAWDEWGEGSVLAPTSKWGFSLLDAISEVFVIEKK